MPTWEQMSKSHRRKSEGEAAVSLKPKVRAANADRQNMMIGAMKECGTKLGILC